MPRSIIEKPATFPKCNCISKQTVAWEDEHLPDARSTGPGRDARAGRASGRKQRETEVCERKAVEGAGESRNSAVKG